MSVFSELFTWWNGNTIGTRLYTWRKGKLVGEDAAGNCYYQDSSGARRWVTYNGISEASSVSADWHAWLHHNADVPPNEEEYEPKEWQQEHRPNMTGTAQAYRPHADTASSGRRSRVTGDYTAWKP